MGKNIGTLDKAARIHAPVVIAAMYFTNIISGTTAIIPLILGGVFIFTSFSSFCPLYHLFGISTNKIRIDHET